MSGRTKWVAYVLVVVFRFGISLVGASSSDTTTHSPNTTESVRVRPCLDKYRRLGSHSACLAPSPTSVPLESTDEDIKLIVDTHNRYRSNVSPTAANMLKMSWDDEIAMIAQAWAENCSLDHDQPKNRDIPGRLSLGQNVGDGYQSWTGVMDAWFVESYHFTYGGDDNVFEKTGHYTQGVWADTNKLGCGASRCGNIIFYVCNYGPAGNIEPIKKPYKKGESCSDCPLHCEDKLCACGDLVCENGGQMVRESCQCHCPHNWLVARECKLNCSAVNEPWYCGKDQFDIEGCELYENVPHDCPVMCGVCPYGGWQYVEGSIPFSTTPDPNTEDQTNNNKNNDSTTSSSSNNNSSSSSSNNNNNNNNNDDDTSAGVAVIHWRHSHSVVWALCVEVFLLLCLCVPGS